MAAEAHKRPVLTTKADAKADLPAKLRIMSHHGFIDENNRHRCWHEGEIIGDPGEIALLLSRGAPVESA